MTSASRCALFAAVLAASLAMGATALAAGPTAQDYETARVLYKKGKELRAKGDLRGALEKLKAAHALGRTPITGLELARTEEQLGMLVEAHETCLGIARLPVLPDESQRAGEARVEAARLADALKPRIASLRIRIRGLAEGVVPIVTVDGEPVPAISLGEPRKMDPGHHVVVAHVERGAPVTASVDLGEAQMREVTLAPPPAPVLAVRPPSGPSPVHHGPSALTVVGIVIGGAGLALGATTGIVAAVQQSDLSAGCPNNACPPEQWGALDTARAFATVSTIGFVAAGAGAVLFGIGLATSGGRHEEGPRTGFAIAPEIGPGYAGVRGAF